MTLVKPKIGTFSLSLSVCVCVRFSFCSADSLCDGPLVLTRCRRQERFGPRKFQSRVLHHTLSDPMELIDDQIDLTSISYTRPSWPGSSPARRFSDRGQRLSNAERVQLGFLCILCFWCASPLPGSNSRKLDFTSLTGDYFSLSLFLTWRWIFQDFTGEINKKKKKNHLSRRGKCFGKFNHRPTNIPIPLRASDVSVCVRNNVFRTGSRFSEGAAGVTQTASPRFPIARRSREMKRKESSVSRRGAGENGEEEEEEPCSKTND